MHFVAQDFSPGDTGVCMPQSDNKGYHHFVWATWDREPLLTGDVERHVYALIRQQCFLLKAELHALGGIEDHVHLFVTLPMTITLADFMKEVKGASARAVNNAYGSPKWSFKWQGGYGYFTVCSSHASTVTRYIENQKQHHADGTLWPSCEPPPKDPSSP